MASSRVSLTGSVDSFRTRENTVHVVQSVGPFWTAIAQFDRNGVGGARLLHWRGNMSLDPQIVSA